MDPDTDPAFPPVDNGGSLGGSLGTSSSGRSHLGDSLRNNPPSQRSPSTSNIMLRISPAAGSATFGYIYLADAELRQQDAITAYFDSAGRLVTALPCPDFESFLADTSLVYRDVLFLSDLPRYVIPAGIRILEANSYIESPHLAWLPPPPDLSSFQPSSRSTGTFRPSLSEHSRSLLSRQSSVGRRPDPDGISSASPPRAPVRHFHMGGDMAGQGGSYGGMSPLTFRNSGSVSGAASIARSRSMGGVGGASAVPLQIFSTSTMVSQASSFVPLAQPDASSVLDDSSSDPSVPVPAPPTPSPVVTFIKDKASDLGLKDITDKDSWIEAKKIIDARLRRPPFCPGPDSKLLLTTNANAVASAWWEEVVNYYVKPPISDLFVEESRFDGKGFEMIAHIDQYFNPSGTVDSLSHIFDLIDIKQANAESVITLKARFSRIFANLKMGGVLIDSALQVGFMLRALRSTYHGVVQDFRLGRHSLSSATLQSVVEQCMAYDKDPWKGPIGHDGKPVRSPSANAAGAGGPGDKSSPYDAMAACSFGTHISRWRIGCKDGCEKCMVCHNTSNKPAHHTKDCPILKQIGLKLVKRTPADSNDAASRVGESPAPAPSPRSSRKRSLRRWGVGRHTRRFHSSHRGGQLRFRR